MESWLQVVIPLVALAVMVLWSKRIFDLKNERLKLKDDEISGLKTTVDTLEAQSTPILMEKLKSTREFYEGNVSDLQKQLETQREVIAESGEQNEELTAKLESSEREIEEAKSNKDRLEETITRMEEASQSVQNIGGLLVSGGMTVTGTLVLTEPVLAPGDETETEEEPPG